MPYMRSTLTLLFGDPYYHLTACSTTSTGCKVHTSFEHKWMYSRHEMETECDFRRLSFKWLTPP